MASLTSPGVGKLRDLSPLTLRALGLLTEKAGAEFDWTNYTTSFAQNADGSVFFTATATQHPKDAVLKVRWAFIGTDGERLYTAYCEESAVREACHLGPWALDAYLDALANGDDEKLDVEELRR